MTDVSTQFTVASQLDPGLSSFTLSNTVAFLGGGGGGEVSSVNSKTGDVTLSASDVGAVSTAAVGDTSTDFVAVLNGDA